MIPHNFLVFFCTLGFYVTFNVVELMFIEFFYYFICVTMMV